MLLQSRVYLVALLTLLVSQATLAAATPPTPEATIEALHQRILRLDRELDRCLVQVAERIQEGAPRLPLADETATVVDQLRGLEAEIRQAGVPAERLLPKLALVEARLSDLRRIDEQSIVPRERGATPNDVGRVGATDLGPPANDDCVDAIEIGLGSFSGSTELATQDGEASCGSSLFSLDVWFKYVAIESGTVFVDTLGSGYDTVLSVHSACPGTVANELDCNDDVFGSDSAVGFIASAGSEHWIRVSGFGGATGSYELNLGTGGALSGTVTRASTSDPLSNVTVDLWDHQGFFVGSQVTDADGLYQFGNLRPGGYFATTRNDQGFLDELYDDLPCPGGSFSFECDPTTGTQVLVGTEAIVAGIDFALDLGGTLTGTVSDSSVDKGLENIRVEIWDASGDLVQAVFSDAAGTYEATGLEPGTYFANTDTSGFFNELYDNLPCLGGAPFGCDPTAGTPILIQVDTITSGIDFVLERLGSISGLVTDAVSGDPISGVRIGIRDPSGNFVRSTTTSADGSYTAGGLVGGTYFATAESFSEHFDELYDDVPCPGGLPSGCDLNDGTPIEVQPNDTLSGIDFVLDRLGTISGTLTEEGTGDPVASIQVEVRDPSGFFVASAASDASGIYTITGLAPGDYFVVTDDNQVLNELYDDLPCEPACVVTTGTTVAAAVNVITSGIDFALVEKGSISGTMTAEATGDPLTFRRVELWDEDGDFVRSTSTDFSGNYSLTALDPGTYFVSTDTNIGSFLDELFDDLPCLEGAPTGCDPTTGMPIVVSLGVTSSGIDFALGQGGEISGSLTEAATGDPIPFVRVEVFDASGNEVQSGSTDSTGFYQIAGLPTGTFFVRTDAYTDFVDEIYDDLLCGAGCDPTTGTGVGVTRGEVTSGIDFALDRLSSVAGTLTEAVSGLPIASGRVEIFDTSGSFVGSDFTDSSGDYELRNLEAGTYFVSTELFGLDFIDELYDDLPCGSGCDPTTGTPIVVGASETVSGIDFQLHRTGAVSGVVTSAAGAPLAGITLVVWDGSGEVVRTGSTDSSGIYTVLGLNAGSYFVSTDSFQVLDELYDALPCESGCDPTTGTAVPVTLDATTRHIDFELDLAGAISGVVTSSATSGPVSGLRLELRDSSGGFVDNTSTNANGVYLFAGLAPGLYFVATDNFQGFADELYDDLPCPGGPLSGCDPTTGTPIPAVANTTTTGIDFELDRLGAIAGRVTDAETGAPLPGARVEIWNTESDLIASRSTDSSGSYAVTDLTPGTYFVSTDVFGSDHLDELYDDLPCFGGAPSGCEPDKGTPLVLAPNGTLSGIDFELQPTTDGLAGTVTAAATGEPQANVLVDVWNTAGQRVASTATSAAGTYFVDLPPATYFVSTDNGVGLVDLVYDGIVCSGSAFAGACDPTLGTEVVIDDSGAIGDPGVVAGIDFALLQPGLFADGFESGNTSLWSLTFGSP